jgi:hypothetical protein
MCEPRRVGDVVDGIDVDRPDVPAIGGAEKGVLGEVEGVAAFDFFQAAGVKRTIVIDLNRIVRKETGSGGP